MSENTSLSGTGQSLLPGERDRAYGGRHTSECLITVKEAAIQIGCCEETIRRAYLAKRLRVEHIGMRAIRVRPSDLQAWLMRGGKTTAA